MSVPTIYSYLAKVLRGEERAANALAMRREGLTFREIGERFGVTPERARQMVTKAERTNRWLARGVDAWTRIGLAVERHPCA